MRAVTIVMLTGFGCAALVLSSAALGVVAVAAACLVARRHASSRLAVLLLATTIGCASVVTTDPALQNFAPRPLGFKGRLAGGAPTALPASVAAALDPAAEVVFTYDERITQTHDELPPVVLILASMAHLLGVPTGRDEVSARAELTISRREHEIGRYRAEAKSSQTYGLYYGANVLDLEDQARAAVRRVIDEALAGDTARLTARADSPQP